MRIDYLTSETAKLAVEWVSHKFGGQFPLDVIPKTGLMVFDNNNKPICVGVLYLDKSSPMAVLGWVMGNPDNKPRESYTAVKLLLKTMPIYAKQQGATHLISIFGNSWINQELDKIGFISGDLNVESKYIRLGGN